MEILERLSQWIRKRRLPDGKRVNPAFGGSRSLVRFDRQSPGGHVSVEFPNFTPKATYNVSRLTTETWKENNMMGRHFQRPLIFITDVDFMISNHESTTGALVCLLPANTTNRHRWSKICAWSRHQYRLKMMASWSSRYSYKHLVMHWLQLFQHRCNFAASGLYWGSRRFYHFLSRLGSYKAWTHRSCGVVELFEEALKLFLPAGWISIEDKEEEK